MFEKSEDLFVFISILFRALSYIRSISRAIPLPYIHVNLHKRSEDLTNSG